MKTGNGKQGVCNTPLRETETETENYKLKTI